MACTILVPVAQSSSTNRNTASSTCSTTRYVWLKSIIQETNSVKSLSGNLRSINTSSRKPPVSPRGAQYATFRLPAERSPWRCPPLRGHLARQCTEGHGEPEFARAANGFGKRVLRLFGAVVILGPKSPSSVVGHSKVRRSYVQLVTAAVVFRHVVRGIRAVFDEAKEPWQFRPGDYDARREERSQGIKS